MWSSSFRRTWPLLEVCWNKGVSREKTGQPVSSPALQFPAKVSPWRNSFTSQSDFRGEGTNRKWPAQHRRHKCFHLCIKTLPPVKLMVSDCAALYQFLVLSLACLTFHCNSCCHCSLTIYVDGPSDNLASKFVYLINNICLCPGSSIHG